MNIKKAVILAAGKGARLDAFETIKPLVKVDGKPLILWQIENLQNIGVEEITIVLAKGDKFIKKFLFDYPFKFNFVEQKEGSKGMLDSILSIDGNMGAPFIVSVCDIISSQNLHQLLVDSITHEKTIASLVSIDNKYNVISGAQVNIKYENGKMQEVNRDSNNYQAQEIGIYYFTPEGYKNFIKTAEENLKLSHVEDVLLECSKEGWLSLVTLKECEWFDINTPETLIRAELFLRKSKSTKEFVNQPEYKQPEKTISFDYLHPMKFDVSVERGIMDKLEDYEIIPHKYYYSPHHILVDKNIDKLYGEKIYDKLCSLGYKINKITVDPGEKTKSFDTFIKLANEIVDVGIDKKSIIIAVGGGVIKDVAGFLASTLYRGIGFISFPTTVLSQCDAAIALKQGVNGDKGKNLIGSYYAPMKIIVDPEVLSTLDIRYVRDGLAECLKQAFAQDKNYYDFFLNYQGPITDIGFLEKAIRKSILLKIPAVQNDFNEETTALIYQYGHEVGHAIEYLSGYKFAHGESVAIGMRVSAELSYLMGLGDKEMLNAHYNLLKKYGLPMTVPKDISSEDVVNMLRYNKKFHSDEARFVLVDKIGSIWHDGNYYTAAVDDDTLKKAIMNSYE